jgi:hypothetical protein
MEGLGINKIFFGPFFRKEGCGLMLLETAWDLNK